MLTDEVVTVKFAALALAGIVIDAGTWAAAMLLARFTAIPPAGAAPVSVTVPVIEAPPVTDEGVTVTVERAPTVSAGLKPSWMTSKSLAERLAKAGFKTSLFHRVS